MEWWCTEADEATQTHCYNPVAPVYPIWAYYVHGRQRRCQEDPVSLPSSRLEKTTRSSPLHVAQHHPTGSETTSPYAPRSSRFGSEPPSVEDDVDLWRNAIPSCMPETTTTTGEWVTTHWGESQPSQVSYNSLRWVKTHWGESQPSQVNHNPHRWVTTRCNKESFIIHSPNSHH